VKSAVNPAFLNCLGRLPKSVRRHAARAYRLWQKNPNHTSLHFKRVNESEPIYSVRIGLDYRALGYWEGDTVTWFWIGTHGEYDALLPRL
jgi:hypothetical protein